MSKKNNELVNEEINAKEVLLIDDEANKLGVKSLEAALSLAEEKGLDCVLVAPGANPPVCKLMDYGRYKFKKEKQQKKARKTQHTTKIRELRVKAKIEEHDLQTKFRKMKEFIENKDKVRFNLLFKGRERVHMEEYKDKIFGRLTELSEDFAVVEEEPALENNRFTILFGPKNK